MVLFVVFHVIFTRLVGIGGFLLGLMGLGGFWRILVGFGGFVEVWWFWVWFGGD